MATGDVEPVPFPDDLTDAQLATLVEECQTVGDLRRHVRGRRELVVARLEAAGLDGELMDARELILEAGGTDPITELEP